MAKEENKIGAGPLAIMIVAGLGACYFIYTKAKAAYTAHKLKNKAQDDSKSADNDPKLSDGTDNPKYNPNKPTLNGDQLKSIAQEINDSIHWYGNDKTAVFSGLAQLKNNADLAALITVFGQAKINDGGGANGFNLGQFLANYYDADVIQAINITFRQNGITNTL